MNTAIDEGGDQQVEQRTPEVNGVFPSTDHSSPSRGEAAHLTRLERPLRRMRRQRWKKLMDHCADTCPRTYAILCGILFPLFALIAVATLFGYWIAQIESPSEIVYNDYQLTVWSVQNVRLQLLSGLTAVTPRICLRLYLQNVTEQGSVSPWDAILNDTSAPIEGVANNETLFLVKLGYLIAVNSLPDSVLRENPLLNITRLYEFMTKCGASIQEGIEEYTDLTVVVPDSSSGAALTFNWNRCTPYHMADPNFTESIRPANQSAFYSQNWKQNASALYDFYYEYYTTPPQNYSSPLASVLASNRSFYEATGALDCVVNQYAGAWFWFTIMTTIGYGNAAIETTEGRILVFTLGFFCILAFGGILFGAGSVVTAISDDAVIRLHHKRFANPWVASFVWGLLYYLWMLVVANFYVNWTERRLGTTAEVSLNDGYWFAYISTTTIGLGDFILTPGVLRAIDMVSWPFNFLVGFVLFSAFVGKLSQIVLKPMHENAMHLEKRLRERGMFFGDARSSSLQTLGDAHLSSLQTDVVLVPTPESELRSAPSSDSEVFISPKRIPFEESGSTLSA